MTEIPYCKETWAVTAGCTKCEKGCAKCWAIRSAQRLKGKGIRGYDKVVDKNGWTRHIELMPWNLDKPFHWRKPRRIFVNSMSDLFHLKVPFQFIDKAWDVMRRTPRHTYLVFTKRPKRMAEFIRRWLHHFELHGMKNPKVGNTIHLILSLSTQDEADEKIPILLQIPAAVRGLSLEPLLEDIDFKIDPWQSKLAPCSYYCDHDEWGGGHRPERGIDWVVVGCESLPGLKAGRFMGEICNTPELESYFYEATRNLIGQCQVASVPIYVKQLPINGKVSRNPKEWPKDLRIQQYPN